MNCLIIENESASTATIKKHARKSTAFNVIYECSSVSEASNIIKSQRDTIDVIFLRLDIDSQSHSSFIEEHINDIHIILISKNAECAKLGFDYNVTDFLQIPFVYSRFLQSIVQVTKNENLMLKRSGASTLFEDGIDQKNANDSIFIKLKVNRYIHLRYDEIHYINAVENYATFVTDNEKHIINISLIRLENKLPKNIFIRVHRSFIINKYKLQAKDGNQLIFRLNHTHDTVPIGSTYATKVMENFDVLEV